MKIKTLLLAVATMIALPSFAVKGVEDGGFELETGVIVDTGSPEINLELKILQL